MDLSSGPRSIGRVSPPIPPKGTVTLGEIQLQLRHAANSSDPAFRLYFEAGGKIYSHVRIPQHLNHPSIPENPSLDQDPMESPTPNLFTLLKSITKYRLPLPTRPLTFTSILEWIIRLLSLAWSLMYDWVLSPMVLSIPYSSIQYAISFFFPEVSLTTLHPDDAVIRSHAWHPYRSMIAFVHPTNALLLYDVSAQEWVGDEPLYHPFHRNISRVAWRPNAPSELFVATQDGLGRWSLPPAWISPKGSNPPPATSLKAPCLTQWLTIPGFRDISDLAVDPSGRLVAATTRQGPSLAIWDIASGTGQFLRENGGGGMTHMTWSPNGHWIATAGPSSLWLWSTVNHANASPNPLLGPGEWEGRKCLKLEGPVKQLEWSPTSNHLLFSLVGDPFLRILCVGEAGFELKKREHTRLLQPLQMSGPIHRFALDPHGERLVVITEAKMRDEEEEEEEEEVNGPADSLGREARKLPGGWDINGDSTSPHNPTKDGDERRADSSGRATSKEPRKVPLRPLVETFYVRLDQGSNEEQPLISGGYLQGPQGPDGGEMAAVEVAWATQFHGGSLLSVIWESGKVTFVPFFYSYSRRAHLFHVRERIGTGQGSW
ncbi:MAG: hypothetical protein DHS80DRAFT_24022 [Piptocephalis tieghemiana]|nr:MAG: hypothetical protein DHS80DRAFT_24022 [Piptocephalis tieghemiana]